jgi:hypothetical protein
MPLFFWLLLWIFTETRVQFVHYFAQFGNMKFREVLFLFDLICNQQKTII